MWMWMCFEEKSLKMSVLYWRVPYIYVYMDGGAGPKFQNSQNISQCQASFQTNHPKCFGKVIWMVFHIIFFFIPIGTTNILQRGFVISETQDPHLHPYIYIYIDGGAGPKFQNSQNLSQCQASFQTNHPQCFGTIIWMVFILFFFLFLLELLTFCREVL